MRQEAQRLHKGLRLIAVASIICLRSSRSRYSSRRLSAPLSGRSASCHAASVFGAPGPPRHASRSTQRHHVAVYGRLRARLYALQIGHFRARHQRRGLLQPLAPCLEMVPTEHVELHLGDVIGIRCACARRKHGDLSHWLLTCAEDSTLSCPGRKW